MFQEYYEGFGEIKSTAKRTGASPEEVALQILAQNRKSIEAYVRRAGLIPESNLIKLSVQAQLIHENEIAKKTLKGKSYEQAEKEVLAEENRKAYFSGEAEEFLGLTLAAITATAKKAIQKINDVRASKGKKPLLSGQFWQNLKKKSQAAGLELTQNEETGKISLSANLPKGAGAQTELGAGLEAAGSEIESQKKKAWIKKNLVWIIVGVAALGIGIYFLAKKK